MIIFIFKRKYEVICIFFVIISVLPHDIHRVKFCPHGHIGTTRVKFTLWIYSFFCFIYLSLCRPRWHKGKKVRLLLWSRQAIKSVHNKAWNDSVNQLIILWNNKCSRYQVCYTGKFFLIKKMVCVQEKSFLWQH